MSWPHETDAGLSFVGSPVTLYRTTSAYYADQAQTRWDTYLSTTLAGSQAVGGRFNPIGEFGAIYTADDDVTAWEESAARFRREGVPGLPDNMRILHILVGGGRYADMLDERVRGDFEVTIETLKGEEPSTDEKEACWKVARAVRSLADFLVSPSSRSDGNNVPLYPDRTESDLDCSFKAAFGNRVPTHLAQRAEESW